MDRYEEALEKARVEYEKARKQGYTWLMDSLEWMFPELRESEDERIRKHLIEIVETYWGKTNEPGKAADLAWLEKRKEYPTNEEMLRTLRVEYEKGVADTIAKYEQKEQKPAEWNKTTINGEPIPSENHSVNIPLAEWSEEDKKIVETICKEGDLKPSEKRWLKSLSERFNLQPKQEWSEDWREEDVQTRFAFYTYKDDPSVLYLSNVFVEETSRNHGFGTRILRAAEKVAETIGATTISLKVKQNSPANAWYRKNGYGYVAFEDGYDWLEKNLEYMKPNKQEWSEEEIRTILDDFAECKDTYTSCINRLKSIRPPQYCENCKLKRSVENW